MSFISELNLDSQGICEDEQTTLSYQSMVFLIALVKGMSMINLKIRLQLAKLLKHIPILFQANSQHFHTYHSSM